MDSPVIMMAVETERDCRLTEIVETGFTEFGKQLDVIALGSITR